MTQDDSGNYAMRLYYEANDIYFPIMPNLSVRSKLFFILIHDDSQTK